MALFKSSPEFELQLIKKIEESDENAKKIIDKFKASSCSIQEEPEFLEKISLDELVDYCNFNRQENTNIRQLAILREKSPEEEPKGQCLTLAFVDENNNLVCLPSGVPVVRKIIVKNLDKKLSDFLRDRDFSLVELKQTNIIVKAIKIASIIIWTLVILLVLLPLLGRLIMTQALAAELNPPPSLEITPNMVAFWGSDNQRAFDKARQTAYKEAQEYAEHELDKWESELIKRLDTDFLDWYFNYFNQRTQELLIFLDYLGEMAITRFDPSIVDDRIKDRIIANIHREFARRVVNSKSAESKFKTILIDTTDLYLNQLSKQLKNVSKKYKITQSDWPEYLEGIKVRLENEQGNQTLAVEIIGAGSYLAIKAGSKVAAKAASKVAAGFLSSSIASIIDPAVGLGLIAFDYWDYTNGVAKDKPRLREDLVESLHQIKKTLLTDYEFGVMSAVNELDEKITDSL
ncbi:hypothetical protein J0895_06190 [Phormidium pseudopriestleyi FRX01]|uniref:Uncharacterized protein n=1 Tax=Phormidium pseudopriestleyi FRX01 TaxID=1759528 RepID=A0ABS3FNL6_9CYAN|nr:hypothetical protein [Phormidium pseudopriestleyi]MBO0348696.1 hypothetical protein [Phormidium pseudopriestleyi FRX01]